MSARPILALQCPSTSPSHVLQLLINELFIAEQTIDQTGFGSRPSAPQEVSMHFLASCASRNGGGPELLLFT